MPIATPTHADILQPAADYHAQYASSIMWRPEDGIPSFTDWCAHCGARIQTSYYGRTDMRSWSHLYPGTWAGSKICDPAQARAAKQGKALSHA